MNHESCDLAELAAEFADYRRNTDAAIAEAFRLIEAQGKLIAELQDLAAEHDAALDRLTAGQPDFLTPAIRRFMRFDAFTAKSLWADATSESRAAEFTGEVRPELIEALEAMAITNPHALGRWLAKREGKGFERCGRTNQGTLYVASR